MISEELRKYIDMVRLEESQDLIHEMANISPKRHGIENVHIFVGSVEGESHWLRVKVSNVPGKYDRRNNFVIRMPSLDYNPRQVADWITPKIMNKIKEWIKLNQKLLYDYETGDLTDTDEFLDRISKV
jgi:hypothetical protein